AGLTSAAEAVSAFGADGTSACGASGAGCGAALCATSSGCEKLAGLISPGAMTTRAPILVQFHILMAKAVGMRIQPCDAGYPGSTPACIATPDQVMRCMYGIGAP